MPPNPSVEDLITSTIASLHARLTRLETAADVQANNIFNRLAELHNYLQKDNHFMSMLSDANAILQTPVHEDNDLYMGLDTPQQLIFIHCDPSSIPYAFIVNFQQGGRKKSAKYATMQEVAQALRPLLSMPAK